MSRIFIATVALSLLPAHWAAAAPPREDVQRIVVLIQKSFQTLADPSACVEVPPDQHPSATNVEQARHYGHIAGMLTLIALDTTIADEASHRRMTFVVENALIAYERAFDCAPTYENREYLRDGVRLIFKRLEHLKTSPALADLYNEQQPHLDERREHLISKIPKKPELKCPACAACPSCPAPPPPPERLRHPKLAIGLGSGAAASAILGAALIGAGEAKIRAASDPSATLPEGCLDFLPRGQYRACQVDEAIDMTNNGGVFLGASLGLGASAVMAHRGFKRPSHWVIPLVGAALTAAAGGAWYFSAYADNPFLDSDMGTWALTKSQIADMRAGYYPSTLLSGLGAGLAVGSAAGLVASRRARSSSRAFSVHPEAHSRGARLRIVF